MHLLLLVVRLIDDWWRVGRYRGIAQCTSFGSSWLWPGRGESVQRWRLLDLLLRRRTAVVTGNRVGRLRRGLGFASLWGKQSENRQWLYYYRHRDSSRAADNSVITVNCCSILLLLYHSLYYYHYILYVYRFYSV